MVKMVLAAATAAGIALAGCTPVGTATGVGAAVGAAVGGAATGNLGGAAAGAAIGAGAGFLVGVAVQGQPGRCYVVDQYGNYLYYAPDGSMVTYQTPYPVTTSC